MKPTVSVVLVVRNVDRFLDEAIESILRQTFVDFEFIIVDFGSTDRSREIVQSHAAKDRRVQLHEIPSCGLGAARNAGTSRAQGRYIAVMDADDISLPDRLRLEVEFMEKHPEVGFLGGAAEWIDATGASLHRAYFPVADRDLRLALLTYSPFCAPTTLIRREAFDRVGGYRPAFAPAEDYDLAVRIAEHFRCANLTEVVLKYRIHPYQLSLVKQREQTLGRLATQVSARARKDRKDDPLNGSQELTAELLAELGVTARVLQNELVAHCRNSIRNMSMAGEYSTTLEAAIEMLHSDLEHVERWRIADMRLAMAELYWKERKVGRSLLTATLAFATRPIMLGRPVKTLLRRLQPRVQEDVRPTSGI